jgi:hypothetical protein
MYKRMLHLFEGTSIELNILEFIEKLRNERKIIWPGKTLGYYEDNQPI